MIEVYLGNLKLKNPLILSSASYTSSVAGIKKYILKGFSVVVTKTATLKPRTGAPNPRVFWYDPIEKTMLCGAEALRNPGCEKMAEAINNCVKIAKENKCLIIGSVAGQTPHEILLAAKEFEHAGASGIEVNLACNSAGPHLGKEYAKIGEYWSATPARVIKVISKLKENVNIPVWVKLVLKNMLKPGYLKEIDQKAKPDAYSYVGGRVPSLVIDVNTGKPILSGNSRLLIEKGIASAPYATGPAKTTTILNTGYLRFLTDTPLIATGGISKGSHVIEAIMVGASAVGISTSVYRDSNVALEILKEIKEIMVSNGYTNIASINGVALEYIRPLL